MKCDFTNKTVCVKPDWVKKFQELTTLFLLSPGHNSLKTAWKVLGNVIWGMRVFGIRQLSFPHPKLWMSRQAKKLAKKETTWRDGCNWWPAALKELREIVRIIVNNKPVHVSKLVTASEDTLWADASGSGGGYILERQGVERAFKWTVRWKKQKNTPARSRSTPQRSRQVVQAKGERRKAIHHDREHACFLRVA